MSARPCSIASSGVSNQSDSKLEEATNELYLKEFTGGKLNERAYEFCTTPLLYSIIFGTMTLETIAGFPWFPGGYLDIFLYGQSWYSFDKFLHFMMSVVIVLLLWSFIKNKWISGAIVEGGHLLWEWFEYGLQPGEIVDTLKDEVINISAVSLAIIVIYIIERRKRKKEKPLG